MESNNSICEISVQTHSWSDRNRHVGKDTHGNGTKRRNSCSASDKISTQFSEAEVVFKVGSTGRITHASWICTGANTGSTRVGQNTGVDLCHVSLWETSKKGAKSAYRDDVCHCKESSEASTDLSQKSRVWACFRMTASFESEPAANDASGNSIVDFGSETHLDRS